MGVVIARERTGLSESSNDSTSSWAGFTAAGPKVSSGSDESAIEKGDRPAPTRSSSGWRSNSLVGQVGLDESGDYDLNALVPLRHRLEEDWADNPIRSRLKAPPHSASLSEVVPAEEPQVQVEQAIPDGVDSVAAPFGQADTTSASQVEELESVPASVSNDKAERSKESLPQALQELPSPPVQRVRPWILGVGACFVLAAFVIPSHWYVPAVAEGSPATFVLGSQPTAEVYRGSDLLGRTPLVIEVSQLGSGLTLESPGYEEQSFTWKQDASANKVEKAMVILHAAPVSLDWARLPSEAKLIWNGVPTDMARLVAALPGTYTLEVKVPKRPSVTTTVVVPAPGSQVTAALQVGAQVADLFANQPQLNVKLDASKLKKKNIALKAKVVSIDHPKGSRDFALTLDLKAGKNLSIALPQPGQYRVTIATSTDYLGYHALVDLKEKSSNDLAVVLQPQVVKAAPQTVGTPSGGYAAPTTSYYVAPSYSSGSGASGGGSGGRIAPPSF